MSCHGAVYTRENKLYELGSVERLLDPWQVQLSFLYEAAKDKVIKVSVSRCMWGKSGGSNSSSPRQARLNEMQPRQLLEAEMIGDV